MSRLDDAEPPPSGEPKPGEVLAGKYEVIRVLGSGGMGVVVAARHLQLDQLVALKLLLHDKSAAASERFVREARAAARITSEHVARVLDVGTIPAEDGRGETAYLVMEHLHGSDLSSLLKTKGPLAIATAVDYVLQACEALAEAHAMGIVHRDLKPANLFLAVRADGSPLVKVLDFGISKSLTPDPRAKDLTATNMILGTPQYMAPEQAHGSKNVDVRTDVWALGAILHELVTGGPPFVAESVQGVLAAILVEPPIPLRSKRRDAPAGLEAAVVRCLEKDASKRFADIGAFCAAIAPFASPGGKVSIERIARVAERGLAAESAAAIEMRARDPAASTVASAAPGWFRGRRVLLGIATFLVGIAIAVGVARYSRSETQESADVATNTDAGAEASAHVLHLPPSAATGAAHGDATKHPHAQPPKPGGAHPAAKPAPPRKH